MSVSESSRPRIHVSRGARRQKIRRGSQTVEFALTFPILLLVFFASIEIARANIVRNTAENAAYEGARRAIIPGGTAANAESSARNILDAVKITGANVLVTPAVITPQTQQVTVRVDVPMNGNTWVMSKFLKDKTITTECTLTREIATNGV